MQYLLRFYLLEILVVVAGLFVSGGAYLFFDRVLNVSSGELTYVSITSAGMLFIIGHVYSRLKERRDEKRKRAQQLFLEWHSKEIRESRIFVSRWVKVNGKENLPSLGELEKEAADAYIEKYKRSSDVGSQTDSQVANSFPHSLNDPELKEFHFFKIYQFFERWAQLVRNSDIDHQAATSYMTSYKSWYLTEFIKPWSESESDKYIKQQLNEILLRISPQR